MPCFDLLSFHRPCWDCCRCRLHGEQAQAPGNSAGRQRTEVATPMDHSSADIPPIDDIIDNFALLDEWEDRYRYVIELGRGMNPLPDIHRCDANKVPGCASQVWLGTSARFEDEQPVLHFCGDSDAHIVRGLVAILLAVVSGKPADQILATETIALFERLGGREH